MREWIKRLARDERGATAIEYGLICALVFLVAISGITAFGNATSTVLMTVGNAINGIK
jgi:pilus assembly protein Flp/PilA